MEVVMSCLQIYVLKSIADTSLTEYDEIIIAADNIDSVSTKKANTIETKKIHIKSTVSINCQRKKVIN